MGVSKYDIDTEQVAHPGTSHALMLELIGSNKRVLDVGCDTGYLGRVLMGRGCTVSGVEMNEASAAEAAQYLERVFVADLETADLVAEFGEAAFDVVVFGDVLEHLRDPLTVLRGARPLLRPGGYVVISTPNIAHGDVRLALLRGTFTYSKTGILDDTHLKFFTRDSLVQFLHDAGFVLTDLRRTQAALFTTELGVREEDFDTQLVDSLRHDVEATTYQFVLAAVVEDAASMQSEQALRIDTLTTRRELAEQHAAELRVELEAAKVEHDRLQQENAGLRAQVADLRRAHDAAVDQRDEYARQLAQGRAVRLARRVVQKAREKKQ